MFLPKRNFGTISQKRPCNFWEAKFSTFFWKIIRISHVFGKCSIISCLASIYLAQYQKLSFKFSGYLANSRKNFHFRNRDSEKTESPGYSRPSLFDRAENSMELAARVCIPKTSLSLDMCEKSLFYCFFSFTDFYWFFIVESSLWRTH